ncbi:hypothetical protein [Paramixta manurensis]
MSSDQGTMNVTGDAGRGVPGVAVTVKEMAAAMAAMGRQVTREGV